MSHTTRLRELLAEMAASVRPGDVYPAKGGAYHKSANGGKLLRTTYWLVVSINGNMAHAVGISACGQLVSTTSYGVHTFAERPRIARVSKIRLKQGDYEVWMTFT